MHDQHDRKQRTRRILKGGALVAAVLLFFFFVPFIPVTTADLNGPNYTALVSLSFAFFQCGDFVGHPGIQVPSGGFANPDEPFASFWNCDYPHV